MPQPDNYLNTPAINTSPVRYGTTSDVIRVQYTNHRGETALRTIRPIRLWFGSTAWHREAQWLLECFDLDKLATRDYALAGMVLGYEPFVPTPVVRPN